MIISDDIVSRYHKGRLWQAKHITIFECARFSPQLLRGECRFWEVKFRTEFLFIVLGRDGGDPLLWFRCCMVPFHNRPGVGSWDSHAANMNNYPHVSGLDFTHHKTYNFVISHSRICADVRRHRNNGGDCDRISRRPIYRLRSLRVYGLDWITAPARRERKMRSFE